MKKIYCTLMFCVLPLLGKFTMAQTLCEVPTQKLDTVTAQMIQGTSDVLVEVKLETEGTSEGYILIGSQSPIVGTLDGSTYTEGSSLLGGIVLAQGDVADLGQYSWDQTQTKYSFQVTHEGLLPSTTYYYAAFLYNYNCESPKYGEVASATIKTGPSAPGSIAVDLISLSEASFNVTANGDGDDVIIVMTDTPEEVRNIAYRRGNFGVIPADASIGDTLLTADGHFGGVVVYMGEASSNIECPVSLEYNTVYYVAAFSQSDEGIFSSTCVQTDDLSPVTIPFKSTFTQFIWEEPLVGWDGTQGFLAEDPREGGAIAVIEAQDGVRQEFILALPEMDFPDDAYVQVSMWYSTSPYSYDFAENDTISFEISTDGGESYKSVALASQYSSSWYLREFAIKDYVGAKDVLMRLRYVTHTTEDHDFSVSYINIDSLAFCSTPDGMYINSDNVYADKAELTWSPSLSGETSWNVCYARVFENDSIGKWSDPVQFSESPAYISGLGNNLPYVAKIQSVCGVGTTGLWSANTEFRSGYSPSFIENFDGLNYQYSSWYETYEVELPEYWDYKYYYNATGSIPDVVQSNRFYYSTPLVYKWRGFESAKEEGDNGALAFEMNKLQYPQVFLLPKVEILPEENPMLNMKVAFGQWQNDAFSPVETCPDAYKMHLWVSTDGGETFSHKEALQSWTSQEIAGFGESQNLSVDLSGLDSVVVLALVVEGLKDESLSASQMLYIDSIGIVAGCANAKVLKIESLTETTATLVWNSDLTVDEWLVKLEGNGKIELFQTKESRYEFNGLTKGTDYMVSVGHLCGEDTSVWSQVTFTTGGVPCSPIEDVTISDVTKNSARLTWIGSADDYKIRIRPVSDNVQPWVYYKTGDVQSYTLSGLAMETQYEGGIQSVCGLASGDTSSYVSFENFSTLGLTCFVPTDFKADATGHATIHASWVGEADSYQVEWTLFGEASYDGRMIVDDDECDLIGLAAETKYQVRVRSVCAVGDTSEWTSVINVTTGAEPICPAPVNLKVESITSNSAKLLWESEEEASSFILRFRMASQTSWDSVRDLQEKSYLLTDLEPATAYVWTVMMQCIDGRNSGWAVQNKFETQEIVGLESSRSFGLFVSTARNQIHLMNPSAVHIERIRVYSTTGRLLENYVVRSEENVLLTTQVDREVVILDVDTEFGSVRFKVLLP